SIARVSRDTTQINTPTRVGTFMVKAIDSLGQESDDYTAAILIDQITDRIDWHDGDGELKLPPPAAPELVPPGVFPGERGTVINADPTRVDVYGFANSLDLGIVCQVSMVAILQARGRYLGRVLATWVALASQVPLAAGKAFTMSTWIPLAMAIPLQMGLSPNW